MPLPAAKIKVKFLDNIKRDEFQLMSQINSICPVNIVDCFAGAVSATITLASEDQLALLTTADAQSKFEEVSLKFVLPPTFKPDRTSIVPKIQPFISNLTTETIIERINVNNKDLEAVDVQIIQGVAHNEGRRKHLKVTFANIDMALQAFHCGFYVGGMLIRSIFVFKEDYVVVQQCYKCFSFDHFTYSCVAESPTCSICSGSHSYRDCPDKSKILWCLCGGKHFAISNHCPKRKEQVKKLKMTRDLEQSTNVNANINLNSNLNSHQTNAASHETPASPDGNPPVFRSAPIPTVNPWDKSQNQIQQQISAFPNLPPSRPIFGSASCFASNSNANTNQGNNLNTNSNDGPINGTSVSAGSVPLMPSPLHSPSSVNDRQGEIHLNIWRSIADRFSGGDHFMYVFILNEFLVQNKLQPIVLPQAVEDLFNNGRVDKNTVPQVITQNADRAAQRSPCMREKLRPSRDSSLLPDMIPSNSNSNSNIHNLTDVEEGLEETLNHSSSLPELNNTLTKTVSPGHHAAGASNSNCGCHRCIDSDEDDDSNLSVSVTDSRDGAREVVASNNSTSNSISKSKSSKKSNNSKSPSFNNVTCKHYGLRKQSVSNESLNSAAVPRGKKRNSSLVPSIIAKFKGSK